MPLALTKAFILAIIAIESGGDNNAVGDQGRSIGCMQISEAVIADVNAIPGATEFYEPDDRYNRTKSIAIFRAYIGHYCTAKRMGRPPTMKDAARVWNAGPAGWRKPCTLKYWNLVKGAMP